MAPYIRPFLAVAQTTLRDPTNGEQYPFMGLYAGRDLPKGTFLGFYSGDIKDGDYNGKDSYVFQLSDVYIKPKKKAYYKFYTNTYTDQVYTCAGCTLFGASHQAYINFYTHTIKRTLTLIGIRMDI